MEAFIIVLFIGAIYAILYHTALSATSTTSDNDKWLALYTSDLSRVLFRIQLAVNELELARSRGHTTPHITNAIVALSEAKNIIKDKGVTAPEAKISR